MNRAFRVDLALPAYRRVRDFFFGSFALAECKNGFRAYRPGKRCRDCIAKWALG